MKIPYLAIFISIVLLSSCIKHKATISEKAIKNLLEQYPQLSKNQDGSTIQYKLSRKIIDNNFSHELELYTAIESYSNNQIIIGIKNNKVFALPFFSPEQSDYWNMDSIYKRDVKNRVDITFDSELKKLAEILQLQKRSDIVTFFREIFQHLLRYSEVPAKPENMEDNPFEIKYVGKFRIFYIQWYKNNEYVVNTEERIGCGYQYIQN